jgi:hypothetical protein
MTARGLGREHLHEVAWGAAYPHPLVSCLMPISALLALAALVLFGFELWQWSLPQSTQVPAVAHLKAPEATRALQRAGLRPRLLTPGQPSEEVPAGCIISTTPIEGRRVKRGRQVVLLVSTGSAFTVVPEVCELTEMAAREHLTRADLLVLHEQYTYDAFIPYERVIAVSPVAGTRLKRMSTVHLTVSQGPPPPKDADRADSDFTRSTVVSVNLPADTEAPQEVRIDLTDTDGFRTVYQAVHDPGESVTHTVQGVGPMTVELYFGTRLLLTRKL